MKTRVLVFLLVTLVSTALFAQDQKKTAEQIETEVGERIEVLAAEIHEETTRCALRDQQCSGDKLNRARFELRELLAKAQTLRATLREESAAEKNPDKVEALSKREIALVRRIHTARDIVFAPAGTAADDLIDQLKATDAALTAAEEKDAALTGAEKEKNKKEQAALRTSLARLERRVKAQGLKDRAAIKEIDDALKSGSLDLEYATLVERRRKLAARLAEIESHMTLPAGNNPLYRVYDDDYEDWWIHQFYIGAEFDSVSGILNKGFARVGYANSLHIGGEDIPESHPRSGWGNYGRYYHFDALLTSTAEQDVRTLVSAGAAADGDTPDSGDPCAVGSTSTDPCVRRALETELRAFAPLWRSSRHNRLRHYFGPVVAVGARFTDPKKVQNTDQDDSHLADYRVYFGTHIGFARDAYSEFLIGRTRSLRTPRLEVRGEVPVAHWGSDSRLLLGWVANIRAGKARGSSSANPPERDVLRVFIAFETDFLKLTGLKPKS